jgi:hypothetical protein
MPLVYICFAILPPADQQAIPTSEVNMPTIVRVARRLILVLCFIGLIATNVLTLTSAAFNTALSGIVGASLGIKTVSSALQSRITSQNTLIKKQQSRVIQQKAATRRFGARLASRTKRVAAKSIAAIPAESIPFIGIAVLIADTSYELYAACETLNDLDTLYSDLGVTQTTPDDTLHSVCNPKLPDAQQVWRDIADNSSGWWDAIQNSL